MIATIFVILFCQSCPSRPFSDLHHCFCHVVLLTITATSCRVVCSLFCAAAPPQPSWTQWHNSHQNLLATTTTSSATSRTRSLNCMSMRCVGTNSRLHLCDVVDKRTEMHVDSLLKRGCGNHCLGKLFSFGARRKNSATALVPMALVTGVKTRSRCAPWVPSLTSCRLHYGLQRLAHLFARTTSPQSALCWIVVCHFNALDILSFSLGTARITKLSIESLN